MEDPAEIPLDLTETAFAPEPQPRPELFTLEAASPEPAPPAPNEEDSLTALMQRLDSGLSRKRQALAAAPDDAAAPAPEPAPEPVRHRLRSAIRDLEQIAARNA
jgi:hypothetical protein